MIDDDRRGRAPTPPPLPEYNGTLLKTFIGPPSALELAFTHSPSITSEIFVILLILVISPSAFASNSKSKQSIVVDVARVCVPEAEPFWVKAEPFETMTWFKPANSGSLVVSLPRVGHVHPDTSTTSVAV